MVDISRRIKKSRVELKKFQHTLHAKQVDREKLIEDIKIMEEHIRQMHIMQRNLRIKKSLLGRTDIDLRRLNIQRKRLERIIPGLEYDLKRLDLRRRFGRRLSTPRT